MSYNLESEVIKAFEQLLKTETEYNVIIHIGEGPNFKEFHAHSNILRCRSEYFNKILSAENVEKKDGKYIIKKPNFTPQAFDIILKYIYTGHINISNKTGTELLDIMIASDEFNFKNLTKLTEDFIIENHHQFLQNDPVGILQIVYYCKPLVNLQEFCLEKVCSEPESLFNSDKFTQLSAPLLEIILKRDDLNLNEIEIWENLIKWGLAQGQALDQDVSKWNQDDINTFKRILYKFIPLIRFYEISTRDYFNKVKPYEEILSKELRDDILKFYMIPEYKPVYTPRRSKYNIDSTIIIDSIIINQRHIILFANWIDRKAENAQYQVKDVPYEFNLLYRASRDGNTTTAFHQKCDNKGATIVIAKVTNSEQIFGGYNPLFWDSSSAACKSTHDSFIFSFTDKNNLQTAKVGYSNGNQYSIGCYSHQGPSFSGGYHLYFCDSGWSNKYHGCSSYPNMDDIPTGRINVDDYEVFQVTKK